MEEKGEEDKKGEKTSTSFSLAHEQHDNKKEAREQQQQHSRQGKTSTLQS